MVLDDSLNFIKTEMNALNEGHTLAKPALSWTDGHILGNGDTGAVVWGTADHLSIGLSKHDVYDLGSPEFHGVRWNLMYPEIVKRVLQGERKFLYEMSDRTSLKKDIVNPLSCGIFTLDLLKGIPLKDFVQKLSFYEGKCIVDAMPTDSAYRWGLKYENIRVSVYVHAVYNTLIIELSSPLSYTITWGFDNYPDKGNISRDYSVIENDSSRFGIVKNLFENDKGYSIALNPVGGKVEISACCHGFKGTVQFGGEIGSCRFILGIMSSYEKPLPELTNRTMNLVSEVAEMEPEFLNEKHMEYWRAFWDKSLICYNEPKIEQLWAMGLYAMGSSTRPDTSPPHLQGIWNQYVTAPWHSDFHFNTNIQMCHWVACTSNHTELQEALIRKLTDDWKEEFTLYAKEQFNSTGMAVPFCIDWLGRATGGIPLATEMSITAWAAQHAWFQWLYTQDEHILKNKIYPFLKECCMFYMDILVPDNNGIYNIEFSGSPEQEWTDELGALYCGFGRNPTIDIVLIRYLFNAVLHAGEMLSEDETFINKCRHIIDNLPPLPKEDGILIDMETCFFKDGDRPGRFKQSHRHPSRLMPIFPCDDIGLNSDSCTLELGLRSFEDFHAYGSSGFTGWSLSYQACIAARLGLGDIAEKLILDMIDSYLMPGLLSSHDVIDNYEGKGELFQIDALLAAPAAVNEMLLQSTQGIIRVFPAVPKSRKCGFKDLRTIGAILVSAMYDQGDVKWVFIKPEKTQNIRLANPWPGYKVHILDSNEVHTIESGDILEWIGEKNMVYKILNMSDEKGKCDRVLSDGDLPPAGVDKITSSIYINDGIHGMVPGEIMCKSARKLRDAYERKPDAPIHINDILPAMKKRDGYIPTCDHGVPPEVSMDKLYALSQKVS